MWTHLKVFAVLVLLVHLIITNLKSMGVILRETWDRWWQVVLKGVLRAPRMRWTSTLHAHFVHVVQLRGGHECKLRVVYHKLIKLFFCLDMFVQCRS